MVKISVVVNTLNEEKNLPRVLASIENFADEMVVCDMHSEDKTVQVAKKLGAKVVTHQRTNYVEPARDFAISKATGDWVLVLDVDEEIPESLKNKLREIAQEGRVDYVKLPRKNIVFGKWLEHSRWWPDYLVRYFKKGKASWSQVIHAEPVVSGVCFELEPKEENAIIHHHYDSLEQYLEKLNCYTTIQAKNLTESGYRFSWKDLISKPLDEFLSRYFFGQGYKDGLHGLALAGLQALSELVLYLKVWQAEGFKEDELELKEVIAQMKKAELDLHYWQADSLFKEGGSFIQVLKRKFKLP